MTDTPTTPSPRQGCVSSVSLPRELSEWVAARAAAKGIAKSKVIQLALAAYQKATETEGAVAK